LNVIDVLARFDVTPRADCVQRLRVKTAQGAGLCRSLPTIAAPTASKNGHMIFLLLKRTVVYLEVMPVLARFTRDPRPEQLAATGQTAVVTRAIRQRHLAMGMVASGLAETSRWNINRSRFRSQNPDLECHKEGMTGHGEWPYSFE
jgi:hypothetical protein